MWIATAGHSRELDRRAMEEYGVPPMVLMERAGLAVFDAVTEMLDPGGRITVMSGRGNNGGDGFVVARHAQQHGFQVEVLVAAEESELSLDAATQLSVARAQGIQPIFYDDPRWQRRAECAGCRDLIVDAVLGTGVTGEVRGPALEAIRAINRSGVPVIAVDVPSGIHTDTGEELGESVWAVRTVTFGLPKPFLFQGIGMEHAGQWTVAEIGLPNELLSQCTSARLLDQEWVASLIPERLIASHKGDHGHVLVVGGSRRMPGAAGLVARAALASGAGLVTLASVESVCDALAASVPECLLLPLPEENGAISPDAADLVLGEQSRFTAAVFGPGLTHGAGVSTFLDRVWHEWRLPCVADADALNAVSEGVSLPSADCVLTPHPGEVSRLMQCSIAEVQSDRFRTVQQVVERFDRTVLLKGAYSIVGQRGMPLAVNPTGNPGMASGGMGDVLSGVIAALLGQEIPSYCAASCGAYWHGLAGDICAAELGCVGFVATDVSRALPHARQRITSRCSRQDTGPQRLH